MAPPRRLIVWLALAPIIAALAFHAIEHWLAVKPYALTTSDVVALANDARAAGGSAEEMMARVEVLLHQRFPGLAPRSSEWVFMRAGGWMGAFKLLYASPSEYLLLFGTALHTSGHSGR